MVCLLVLGSDDAMIIPPQSIKSGGIQMIQPERLAGMAVAFDLDLAFQGRAVILNFFQIDQFHRAVHTGIAGASSGVMFLTRRMGSVVHPV